MTARRIGKLFRIMRIQVFDGEDAMKANNGTGPEGKPPAVDAAGHAPKIEADALPKPVWTKPILKMLPMQEDDLEGMKFLPSLAEDAFNGPGS